MVKLITHVSPWEVAFTELHRRVRRLRAQYAAQRFSAPGLPMRARVSTCLRFSADVRPIATAWYVRAAAASSRTCSQVALITSVSIV